VGDWTKTTRGYAAVVRGAGSDADLEKALIATAMARVVHRDSAVVVLRLRRTS